jgi:acyl carrier protein
MFDKIKELITNYVEVDEDAIKPESRFIEDLSFNSFDFMSMLGDIEDTFGVTVNDEDVLKLHTVGEAVTYLETLTEGK